MDFRWVRRGAVTVAVAALLVAGVRSTLPSTSTPVPTYSRHSVIHLPGYSSNGVLEKPSPADLAQVATPRILHTVLGIRATVLARVSYAELDSAARSSS